MSSPTFRINKCFEGGLLEHLNESGWDVCKPQEDYTYHVWNTGPKGTRDVFRLNKKRWEWVRIHKGQSFGIIYKNKHGDITFGGNHLRDLYNGWKRVERKIKREWDNNRMEVTA